MALSVGSTSNNLFTHQSYNSARKLNESKGHKRLILRANYSSLVGHKEENTDSRKKLKILIAGGGIGGLVFALAAKRSGFDVKVFEKELTAVRGEGVGRGPIQLFSSGLSVQKIIDHRVAEEIMEAGFVTGDKENGIADGMTGEWCFKFDFLGPAVARGVPVTQIISRIELQRLLVNAVGTDTVLNNSQVVDFVSDANKVRVFLENGEQHDGDVLIGADGIRSMVRSKLFGPQDPKYSNFTYYTAITELNPKYFHQGYKVFLGNNQFFVALNLGNGRMQWYAFVKEPHQSPVSTKGHKRMLMERFGEWCDEIFTSIREATEDTTIKRPIYDIDVVNTWSKGRVILLGDAAHAMLPSLSLGGTLAIEDCYWLMVELQNLVQRGPDLSRISSDELALSFKRYEKKRKFRVRVVHSVSRIALMMTSFYFTYLDFGRIPLPNLSSIRVKNHGLVITNKLLQLAMPKIVEWIADLQ